MTKQENDDNRTEAAGRAKNELLSGWYWAQASSTYSSVHWNPVFITDDGFYWTNGMKKPVALLDSVELHKAVLPEAG